MDFDPTAKINLEIISSYEYSVHLVAIVSRCPDSKILNFMHFLYHFWLSIENSRKFDVFNVGFWCWPIFVCHLFLFWPKFRFPRWLLELWNLKCNDEFSLHLICCCSQFKDLSILCILDMRYAMKFSRDRSRICNVFSF